MQVRLNDLTGWRKVVCISLRVLILLTLAFIFTQSMLSPAASGQESDAVAGFLSSIFPKDSFIIKNLRQLAHFAEYGMLGVEISLYICLYLKNIISSSLISLGVAQSIALIDETLQIFSGRVSDVRDVWTDFLGFLTLSAITYLVFFLVKNLKIKKDKSNG
jgi:VanZ family protein